MIYEIRFSPNCKRKYIKLKKRSPSFRQKMSRVLYWIRNDPFYPGLKTHKVATSKFGTAYSSRITKDLRILWTFRKRRMIILALTIGGHSGKSNVYN